MWREELQSAQGAAHSLAPQQRNASWEDTVGEALLTSGGGEKWDSDDKAETEAGEQFGLKGLEI